MRINKPRLAHGQRGFSLLEVIVAFVILVLCVSVVLRVFGGSAMAAIINADYLQAVSVAEAKMAELKIFSETGSYRDNGETDGGFRWQVNAQAFNDSSATAVPFSLGDDATTRYRLYTLEVNVAWGTYASREIALKTLAVRQNHD